MKTMIEVLRKAGFAVLFTVALTGCNITGGGVANRVVQDGLPGNAAIYVPQPVKGGKVRTSENCGAYESCASIDHAWHKYLAPVPCSDIGGVVFYAGGDADGKMGLRLITQQYGGKYYPPVRGGQFWRNPQLLVGIENQKGKDKPKTGDFTKAQAEEIAEHCAVPFQIKKAEN